jgi:DNA-binding Lrp family transcriptional regulator
LRFRRSSPVTWFSGEVDYLLEVVVPDLDHYRSFLLSKLLELSIVREVRSNIAIQTLKAGAILPSITWSKPNSGCA